MMLILLLIVLTAADMTRLAMIPVRVALLIDLLWGVVAGLAAITLSGMSQDQVAALTDLQSILILAVIESLLFIASLLVRRPVASVLRFYPGVMLAVPVVMLASVAVRSFPGISFSLIALLTGIIVALSLIALLFFFRRIGPDANTLWVVSLISLSISIIIFGMT
ncbi:MAG: hypothetical protein K2J18_08135 [Paramuribaculum sp.]|nr:hypothetical protein [Bacteroides sp.]MBD5308620.1 hypothetical protein [Bacteroides sp.]MDE6826719.1 hypothetical protein [Paramuribaculum sp.]MDE7471213.1 hypothetical protein [Paramuribaculum sp.]